MGTGLLTPVMPSPPNHAVMSSDEDNGSPNANTLSSPRAQCEGLVTSQWVWGTDIERSDKGSVIWISDEIQETKVLEEVGVHLDGSQEKSCCTEGRLSSAEHSLKPAAGRPGMAEGAGVMEDGQLQNSVANGVRVSICSCWRIPQVRVQGGSQCHSPLSTPCRPVCHHL